MSKAHHGPGRVYKKGAPNSEYEDMNARRQSVAKMEKKMGHKIPKGMEVDHHDSNPQNKSVSNLRVIPKAANLKKEQLVDNKRKKK